MLPSLFITIQGFPHSGSVTVDIMLIARDSSDEKISRLSSNRAEKIMFLLTTRIDEHTDGYLKLYYRYCELNHW